MKYTKIVEKIPMSGLILDIKDIMADKVVEKVGRPMKFPYTFSAKVAQFPYKFYFSNQWIWKYYAVAMLVTIPLFKSISNLSNSPENVAKWAEIRRKEAAEHH
ncbi:unnamed protein product [Brassicogethes aeneus]|uniref:Uncharacterized protein n=1 Tax=Brassicogethes aeneus TaxID=1431903 RepID=A0A9P0AXC8_BRAAE|nr:unnamed protein product [Brassicogethes aeneus]